MHRHMTSRYLSTTPSSTLIKYATSKNTHDPIWVYRVYLTSRPSCPVSCPYETVSPAKAWAPIEQTVDILFWIDLCLGESNRPGDLPSQNGWKSEVVVVFGGGWDTGWWQPEIWQTHQLMMVGYPIIYRILAPSKRWLGMGILNHQQYVVQDSFWGERCKLVWDVWFVSS